MRTAAAYVIITAYLAAVITALVMAPLFMVTIGLAVTVVFLGLAYHHQRRDLRRAARLAVADRVLLRRLRYLADPPPADLIQQLYDLPSAARTDTRDQEL